MAPVTSCNLELHALDYNVSNEKNEDAIVTEYKYVCFVKYHNDVPFCNRQDQNVAWMYLNLEVDFFYI